MITVKTTQFYLNFPNSNGIAMSRILELEQAMKKVNNVRSANVDSPTIHRVYFSV